MKLKEITRSMNARNLYQNLYLMAIVLNDVTPSFIRTKNPYSRFIDKAEMLPHINREQMEELYHLLVHGLTSMNYLYREQHGAFYFSSKEDNMQALLLIQKIAFPDTVLGIPTIKTYNRLWMHYKQEYTFTINDAVKVSKRNKTTAKTHFYRLMEAGKIIRVGGNGRVGYLHKLVSPY